MSKMRDFGWLVAVTYALALPACGGPQGPEPKAPNSAEQGNPPPPGGPDGAGPGEHRAPPEEAFTACDGKKEDDACSVKRDNEEIAGSCKKGPDAKDAKLACMPKDGPKGGPGGPQGGPPPDGEKPKEKPAK